MRGPSRVWLVLAVLFTLVNLVGGVMAAYLREPMHAALHLALLLPGAYAVWRLAPSRSARRSAPRADDAPRATPGAITERLRHLERSVDDVAVEVERIGEGQRFMTRVLTERPPDQSSPVRPTDAGEVRAG